MVKHVVAIGNPKGIHLNPATKIAKFAMENPELKIRLARTDREGHEVDASSVISILTLELKEGAEVLISMAKESEEALRVLSDLLQYDESHS